MVAKSSEDGEKACTCVNVERPRSGSTKGMISNNGAVYSAACHTQSNDGHTYIGVDTLNGRSLKVLRDTGCSGMLVDRALIPDVMVIPGSSDLLQILALL